MARADEDILVDPGDWYSDLFSREHEEPVQPGKKQSRAAGKPAAVNDTPMVHTSTAPGPENGATGERAATPGEQKDLPREDSPERGKELSGGSDTVPLVFLVLSVLVCAGTLFFLFSRDDLLLEMMPPLRRGETSPASPYLLHRARSAAARDVHRFMQLKRGRLYRVHRELHELEEDRERFLARMEQRRELFVDQRSLFGLDEDRKELRSITHLIGMSAEFRGELLRRRREYLAHYRRRRKELERLAGRYQEELDLLARLSGDIASREQEPPGYRADFFLSAARREHLARLVRALRNQDLESAADAAGILQRLPAGREERELAGLVGGLAAAVQQYANRMETLITESPLRSLVMRYLAEEYDLAEEDRVNLERDELLRPLLAGLDERLFTVRKEAGRIKDGIARDRSLQERVALARRLEGGGDLEEAITVYHELLLGPLQPHDREYLAGKLRSLWVPAEMKRIKREQNTRAIKYLESARLLEKEGRDLEALEFYAMLVKECPSSDYVRDAMNRILQAARFSR